MCTFVFFVLHTCSLYGLIVFGLTANRRKETPGEFSPIKIPRENIVHPQKFSQKLKVNLA